jgi:hypothetical protein
VSTPAKVEQLANSVGEHRTCSDLFIDASGGLILLVTKTRGGSRELAAARQAALAHGERPRPVPGVSGGFVAGQHAGFLEHGQVVSLTSGYTSTGQPELTAAQLARLAGVVAQR